MISGFYTRVRRLVFNHRLGSWAGAAFFLFWIGQRFHLHYRPTLLWWLITFQFALFILAYIARRPARVHAGGVMETLFPFACAAMPFALDRYWFKPPGQAVAPALVSMALMAAGTCIIIGGVWRLRGSFSIMTEVRAPVVTGLYRFTRHPMYLGSMIASLGILLSDLHGLNVAIYIIFCVMQVIRARFEENKIGVACPEYRDYAARVGWLGPIGRRRIED